MKNNQDLHVFKDNIQTFFLASLVLRLNVFPQKSKGGDRKFQDLYFIILKDFWESANDHYNQVCSQVEQK